MLNDVLTILCDLFNELPVGAGFDDSTDGLSLVVANNLRCNVISDFRTLDKIMPG